MINKKLDVRKTNSTQKNMVLFLCCFLLICSTSSFAADDHLIEKKSISRAERATMILSKRFSYQDMMQNAYAKYPSLPKGLLESLAFSTSRWSHRLPQKTTNHHGMPQAVGLFGLHNTDEFGFINILLKISLSQNVTVQNMKDDESVYIDATAAYISAKIESKYKKTNLAMTDAVEIESLGYILAELSGIRTQGQITKYSRDSFVYDILMTRNKGFNLGGLIFDPIDVDLTKAFNKAELKLLGAPQLIIDRSKDQVKIPSNRSIAVPPSMAPNGIQSIPGHKKKVFSAFTRNKTDSEYPGALWVDAANFSSRSGSAITHITIHTMQGSYSGSISFFQNPATQASAHYMMRSSDGQITQMVLDADKAWHVRNSNPYTIGIEHEGFVDDASWYTEEMMTESAKLTAYKCEEYSIDCSKAYSGISHDSVVLLSEDFTVKGHQHYPDQSHTDPGINWDWPYYYSLVTGGAIPNRFPEPNFSYQCNEFNCTFDATSSSDPDGTITSYAWDFKDGNLDTGSTSSHTFSSNGSYKVKLTVTDNSSAAADYEQFVSVRKNIEPTEEKSGGGGMGYLLALILLIGFSRKNK